MSELDDIEHIKLLAQSDKSYKKYDFSSFNGLCKIVKITDGDTYHFVFRYNNGYHLGVARCIGVNTPELKSKDEELKKKAYFAKEFFERHFLNKIVKFRCFGIGDFGRYLCDFYPICDERLGDNCVDFDKLNAELAELCTFKDEMCFTQIILQSGMGVVYEK